MKVGLRVKSTGSQEGKILPITLSQFLIGRDKQCHLRPASPSISKRHCAVIVSEDKVIVRDFDSTNGTFVNDEPLKGQVEVKNKDRLRAGPLEFEILIVRAEAGEADAPSGIKRTEEAVGAAASSSVKESAGAKDAVQKKPSAPADKPSADGDGDSDDDDVAAMLLAMQDDGDEAASLLETSDAVPEGSTVMDMAVPPMPGAEGETKEGEGDPSKMQKEKDKQANTSSAAKNILEKYMRRPR